MEFGLMVEPQVGGTYEELLALAKAAESAGFDSIARSDHYLAGDKSAPTTDALTSLGGLARETSNIRLTVLVTPLTFRHPGVIAKTATTLDEMSGGRFELGIGTGWMESEHRAFGIPLPEMRTRFSLLFETLAYVHAATGRTEGGYSGRHFRLENVDLLPQPLPHIPIIVGGMGPKRTPSIAGRFADEYNLFASSSEDLGARVEVMRKTAVDVGRYPEHIKLSITSSAVVGENEAEYREALAEAAAKRGKDPAELEADLSARRMLHGTYEQVDATIAEYENEGVRRIYLQHFEPLSAINMEEVTRCLAALRD